MGARLAALADRLDTIDPDGLVGEEALTRSSLRHAIASDRSILDADASTYTVDAMSGPQVSFLNIASLQPLRDEADGAALLARWRAMAPWLDEAIDRLRTGRRNGLAPIAVSIHRVIAQIDETLDRPIPDWPLSEPARAPHDGWSDAAFRQFADALLDVVSREIRPAFARYRAYLADEALPHGPRRGARRDEQPPRRRGHLCRPGPGAHHHRAVPGADPRHWPRGDRADRRGDRRARGARPGHQRSGRHARRAALRPCAHVQPAATRSWPWPNARCVPRKAPCPRGSAACRARPARCSPCRRTRRSTPRSRTTGSRRRTVDAPAATT